MKPVDFPEANTTFAKNQPQYLPLPAYRTNDGAEVTSCWQMTWRERLKVLITGRVYCTLLMYGQPLTPQKLDVDGPQLAPEGEPY